MKMIKFLIVGLSLSLGLANLGFAASNEVLVVFHGQTQVNREAYNFLRRNFSSMNTGFNVSASQNLQSVKPGTYRAIVVMNSGYASGIDPVLKAFIDAYSNKSELFLVNLQKGSVATSIQTFSASTSPAGIDALTAPSYWAEGAEKLTYIKVHQDWIKILAEHIKLH